MDWTKLYKKYAGKWVTLADDEKTVISAATTAKKAFDAAKKQGSRNPIITKIPKKIIQFVGHHEISL